MFFKNLKLCLPVFSLACICIIVYPIGAVFATSTYRNDVVASVNADNSGQWSTLR